jgi:hypothetical protein
VERGRQEATRLTRSPSGKSPRRCSLMLALWSLAGQSQASELLVRGTAPRSSHVGAPDYNRSKSRLRFSSVSVRFFFVACRIHRLRRMRIACCCPPLSVGGFEVMRRPAGAGNEMPQSFKRQNSALPATGSYLLSEASDFLFQGSVNELNLPVAACRFLDHDACRPFYRFWAGPASFQPGCN